MEVETANKYQVICECAKISVYVACSNVPNGYRGIQGLDNLPDVLPLDWHNLERGWLEDCLEREPTKREWFAFWLYWRFWKLEANHKGVEHINPAVA